VALSTVAANRNEGAFVARYDDVRTGHGLQDLIVVACHLIVILNDV